MTFVQICIDTFAHVDDSRAYDQLWSTRHWAQALFFYALNRRVDGVATYFAERRRVDELALFARMYADVHGASIDEATSDAAVVDSFALMACSTNQRLRQLIGAMTAKRGDSRETTAAS